MSYLLETSHVLTCVPKSDGFDQVNSLGNIQAVVWTSGSQEFNFNSAIDFFPLHLLQKKTRSWLAVVLSVSLVLMFGEIIPSAVFTGSEQLTMAARFSGLVGSSTR